MSEKLKITTNTAYLLNMWFPESTAWKEEREFINKLHEEHWKGKNSGIIEVTFKIKQGRKKQ